MDPWASEGTGAWWQAAAAARSLSFGLGSGNRPAGMGRLSSFVAEPATMDRTSWSAARAIPRARAVRKGPLWSPEDREFVWSRRTHSRLMSIQKRVLMPPAVMHLSVKGPLSVSRPIQKTWTRDHPIPSC